MMNFLDTSAETASEERSVVLWPIGASARTLIWITDADDIVVYLNRPETDAFLLGAPLPYSKWVRSIHPDDRSRVIEIFRDAKARRQEYQVDYRIVQQDVVRWISGSGVPRVSQGGEFQGYTGSLIDVTDRYDALALVAKSEAMHRLLTENSFDLISQHAAGTGVYAYASPSFRRVLGYDPGELVGKESVYAQIHPDDTHVVRDEIARQTATGADARLIEFRVRHRDGHYRWMGSMVKLLTQPGTQQHGGSVAVTRDITAERQAREELKRREERFAGLTNLSSDWYWETDEQDRYTFLSGTSRPSRLPAERMIGATRTERAADPAQPAFQEYLAKVARRESFRDIVYATVGLPDEIRHASISGEPVYEDGAFKGYRGVGRDITDEVRTAEKLALLADENAALVENSVDIIALLDQHGRFLRVNQAAHEILGFQPEEVLGRSYTELLHPDDVETVQAVETGLRTGKDTVRDIENRWIARNGEVVYLSLAMRWSRHKQLVYVTARDVTERYRTREELQRSRSRLKTLLESIGDAFFAVDGEWRITYANRKAAQFAGLAAEDGVGRLLWEVLPKVRDAAAFVPLRRAMQARQQEFADVYWAPKWIEVHAYPQEDGLSVFFHDITAKRESENALRKSEQRFKNLFEQAGDGIFITDRALRIRDVNRSACQMLGYEREELLALSIPECETQFQYDRALLEALRKGQSRMIRGVKRRKDGTTFPAEMHISRFEEDGKELFQAVARDLTEREEAQRKIMESERRVREVIEMTPAGYILVDDAGRVEEVNPAICQISGHAREALIGKAAQDLFSACPLKEAGAASAVTSIHGMEAVLRHATGREIFVLINSNIPRNAQGEPLSHTLFLTDITERKQAERRLEQLASCDTLTGLPNRAYLNDRIGLMLEQAPRGQSIAVMFIDLDRFKEVNDSFGHEPGDRLLREVGRRLKKNVRPSDLIARLGGDEFVVAAHCSAGVESAAAIAQKLLATLSAPFDVSGFEVLVGASIGISMFPQDGRGKGTLFQHADTAMYRAKAAGRNRYCFYEAEMSVEAKTRMTLETSLRRALERGEFEIEYQPRIELDSMTMVGMEALLRWNHPELGRVSPLQFIPIAEERGLIEPIGLWVLQQACSQTRRLLDKFGVPLRVSVNLSARQLKAEDLVEQVRGVLEESRLPPELLELELTETALVDDLEGSAIVLRELKRLGISLAVDDFGTGYSALAYLRSFPLDVLKLDRSFVVQSCEGTDHFQFIKAFVDLAHALKLEVVAEGVEGKEALKFLREVRCDQAQGYLFSRPLPLAAFERYLVQIGAAPAPAGLYRAREHDPDR